MDILMDYLHIPAIRFNFYLPLDKQDEYEVAVCDEQIEDVISLLEHLPDEIPKPESVLLVDPDDNPYGLPLEVVLARYSINNTNVFLSKILGVDNGS
jgi:hypothetical protein